MDEITGIVFNTLRYTIDDGPGIRSTVFLKGCPLRCPWCSNPESQKKQIEILHRKVSCLRCGRCEAKCPNGAIKVGEDGPKIDRSLCTACETCVMGCPNKALQTMGVETTVAEAYKKVMKDRDYYESTNGGVTVSGGEPLMQPEFVAALCEKLQASGIHTCIETTGFADRKNTEKVLPHLSLVYFDLKHMDSKEHQRVTGVPNELILENFKYIVSTGTEVVVRIPYIPGFNDSDENMEATARFVAEVLPGAEVHLLPYHNYGEGKYESLDRTYPMTGLERPPTEQVERSKTIFDKYNLKCIVKI